MIQQIKSEYLTPTSFNNEQYLMKLSIFQTTNSCICIRIVASITLQRMRTVLNSKIHELILFRKSVYSFIRNKRLLRGVLSYFHSSFLQVTLDYVRLGDCPVGRVVISGGRFWAALYRVLLGRFGHPPFWGVRKRGGGEKEGEGGPIFLGDIQGCQICRSFWADIGTPHLGDEKKGRG